MIVLLTGRVAVGNESAIIAVGGGGGGAEIESKHERHRCGCRGYLWRTEERTLGNLGMGRKTSQRLKRV